MLKDNFSKQAKLYATFRPHYPQALYQFIYDRTRATHTAWDCATGNGQVAKMLSHKFEKVFATDISEAQLKQAETKHNIYYAIGSAESSGINTKVDLITVGQAIHWFDLDKFYNETLRLAKAHTILSYWGYGLVRVNKEIDKLFDHFYYEITRPYWDPERKLIDNKYSGINLPLKGKIAAEFVYKANWTLAHFCGYLSSWSAVQKIINKNNINPVDELQLALAPHWKNDLEVSFPIFLTLGSIH